MAVVATAVLIGFPLCPVGSLTGVPCPGCGLGRATVAFLRGDWRAALALHPLSPVAIPGLVGLAALGTGTGHSDRRRRVTGGAAGVLLAALVAVWAFRFLGWLGGPVPVDTYREYRERSQTLKRKCITSPSWTT